MILNNTFNRYARRVVAILTIALLPLMGMFSSVAQAQPKWTQLESLSTVMYCAYFFDANDGVVGGNNAIWRYHNGGWTQGSTPDANFTRINSISELKPGVLYATTGDTYIWVSTDSGGSWHNTTTPGSFALDAYIAKDSLYATYAGLFARIDSNICVVSNNNGSAPSYSSDGGITWHASTGTGIGGLGLYGDSCRKMFFASSKSGPAYYSVDSGHTWHATGASLPSDILGGCNDAVYRQDSVNGVYVSVDAGTTWQSIGGPKATGIDRGICGCGTKGKYIIAMSAGEVWQYDWVDSLLPTSPIIRGDTSEKCPISEIPIEVRTYTHPVQVSMNVVSGNPQTLKPIDTSFELLPGANPITLWYSVSPTIAQDPTFVTIFTNVTDGCRTFSWEDTFSIVPVPIPFPTPNVLVQNCAVSRLSLEIPLRSYALRMRLLASADSGWSISPTDTAIQLGADSVGFIYLTPKAPSLPIGTLVHLYATDTTSCTIYTWDTAFTIGIKPVPISFKSIDSVGTYACDSIRVPVTFDLATCDSLAIDTLTVNPSNGLMYFENTPPSSLTRNRMDTVWLVYAPRGANEKTRYQVSLRTHFVPEGTPYDTTFQVIGDATGAPTPHISATSTISLNSCTPTTLPLYIKAAGCEPVVFDSAEFFANGLIVSGGPSAPDTIAIGATDTARYSIEAPYPGMQSVTVNCNLYRLNDQISFDTVIRFTVSAAGANDEPLISSEPTLTLSNCTPSIVPFVLHAPCDSLTISSCAISMNSGASYDTNLTFPLQLSAESTDSLLLSFPPQGLNQLVTIQTTIKGSYRGSSATFDTTAQSKVTFACAGVSDDASVGPLLGIASLQMNGDQLQLEITKNDNAIGECQAEILTLLGSTAAQKIISLPSQQNSCFWDLSSFPTGAYYVRLMSGGIHVMSRFVLIH